LSAAAQDGKLLHGGALLMNLVNYIWLYFWIVPHLLLIVVAGLMLRRGLHRTFPVFFFYLFTEFLMSVVLFGLHWMKVSRPLYVQADLLDRAISIALHFGILQELFFAPIADGAPPHRDINRLLKWMTATMIVIASVFTWATYYSSFGSPMVHTYLIVETLQAAQCGLLVCVFLWYSFLGARMSPMVFGISLGLGMAFGLEPFLVVLKNHVAPSMYRFVDIFQMGVFHVATLVWIYYALATERVPPAPTISQSEWLEQAAKLERVI
jgi:hypothetical protein